MKWMSVPSGPPTWIHSYIQCFGDTFFMKINCTKCSPYVDLRNENGIFWRKFNPWSNTPWHQVRPPLKRSSFLTASLCSVSNLRKERTITIHCSLCSETANKKSLIAANNARTKLQQQYKYGPSQGRAQTIGGAIALTWIKGITLPPQSMVLVMPRNYTGEYILIYFKKYKSMLPTCIKNNHNIL